MWGTNCTPLEIATNYGELHFLPSLVLKIVCDYYVISMRLVCDNYDVSMLEG